MVCCGHQPVKQSVLEPSKNYNDFSIHLDSALYFLFYRVYIYILIFVLFLHVCDKEILG